MSLPADLHDAFAGEPQYARWRLPVVQKQRIKTERVTPMFIAYELLYHAYAQNADLLDAVLVVQVSGGLGDLLHAVATPNLTGRRIIRLLWTWEEVEPHLHLSARRLSSDVLAEMAKPGGVLRASVRQARVLTG